MSRSSSKKSANKPKKTAAASVVAKTVVPEPENAKSEPSPKFAPLASATVEPTTGGPSERFYLAALGVLVLGIALRQLRLGEAAFHPDEAIHAFFSYGFAGYKFDPVYHGPLLYHLVSAIFQVFGQHDYTARLVPSLLGIGLIALILGPARVFLGQRAALIGAALVAVSPSIVTYSRHLLHDALVLVLTLGAVLCFWTALVKPAKTTLGRSAIIGLAACLTLFLATKANFFFIAVVISAFWLSWRFPRRIAPALVAAVSTLGVLLLAVRMPQSPLGSLMQWPTPSLIAVLAISSIGAGVTTWFILPQIPNLPRGQWPLAVFGLVVFASIFWPRDNTFTPAEKDSQHLIFQLVAVASCGVVWYWLFSRKPDETEAQGRENWQRGRDWVPYVLALAVALWLYLFLFGNGAQIIAQWVQTREFPSEMWVQGRESAQSAIKKMLDYWGGQQKTPRLPGRHDYYLVLALLYEIPILMAGIAGLWHAAKNRSLASDFLVWWAFASWTVYAVANEKVPWLLVHQCLPLALLGGVWLASLKLSRLKWAVFASLGLIFCLRGNSAMIFERAGDNAEPILYAQTPDAFRDSLTKALTQTRGDGRAIWMEGERQWPSVWYLRDDKNGSNALKGGSGTPIAGDFKPEEYRAWIGKDEQWQKIVKSGQANEWQHETVGFLIWPRVSWAGMRPDRYWHWFWTRETMPENERLLPQNQWETSILAGKGEWSRADAVIGWR